MDTDEKTEIKKEEEEKEKGEKETADKEKPEDKQEKEKEKDVEKEKEKKEETPHDRLVKVNKARNFFIRFLLFSGNQCWGSVAF